MNPKPAGPYLPPLEARGPVASPAPSGVVTEGLGSGGPVAITWTGEGRPCRCGGTRVADVMQAELADQGPQGGWQCDRCDRQAWIWPDECVADALKTISTDDTMA